MSQPALTIGAVVAASLIAVLVGITVLGGCASDGDRGAEVGAPQPTAAVVLPSAADSTNATVVGSTRLPAGVIARDASGNELTMHAWMQWPEPVAALEPFDGDGPALFAVPPSARDGQRLVAVNVEVCASQRQQPGQELFRSRFQPIDPNPARAVGVHDPALMVLAPLVSPAFSWPTAGTCSQGWQTLLWGDEGPPAFQYTAVSGEASNFGEQEVWIWENVPLAQANAVIASAFSPEDASPELVASSDDRSDEGVRPGSTQGVPVIDGLVPRVPVTIGSGQLDGWTFTVHGWTDVPDTATGLSPTGEPLVIARSGTRFVGLDMEVCAGAVATLFRTGLQVDGWNLIAERRGGGLWGAGFDPLDVPLPGDCDRGWVGFELPIGLVPSGVVITESVEYVAPWMVWSFARDGRDRIEPPTPAGFPPAPAAGTATATVACPPVLSDGGAVVAVDEVVVDLRSDVGVTWPVGPAYPVAHAVAVWQSDSRVDVHLSDRPLDATDLPVPRETDHRLIRVELVAADGAELGPGSYGGSPDGDLVSRVLLVQGGSGGLLPLDDVSVVITSIDDAVCGWFLSPDTGPVDANDEVDTESSESDIAGRIGDASAEELPGNGPEGDGLSGDEASVPAAPSGLTPGTDRLTGAFAAPLWSPDAG